MSKRRDKCMNTTALTNIALLIGYILFLIAIVAIVVFALKKLGVFERISNGLHKSKKDE